MSLVDDDKIQGSAELKNNNVISGPPTSTNSLQTQFKILKRAVAKCPKVNVTIMGENMPSLLDSSSMVSLMQQTYFNRYFRLQLGPAEGAVAEAHNLFDLKSANGRGIPLSRYVELDIEFLGLKVPKVGFLITQNPNEVLDPKHKTRLPGIVEWNLVRLAYEEFTKEHSPIIFENFKCPEGVEPLLFSQLCIYYYVDKVPAVVHEIQAEDGLVYTEAVTKNKDGKITFKKHQNSNTDKDEPVGTVMIGTDHQPVCVPGNATITVPGKILKVNNKVSYMLETAAHANLPSGIVVNCSYDTPKSGRMSVILVNTTNRNIWIRQLLLAADIYEVELHPWQYCTNLNREGNDIKINFQLTIPPEIECDLQCNQVETEGRLATSEVQENPQPTFGPHPDVRSNYNFKDEVQCLPFKFNLGDAPFNKKQQD